MSQYVDTTWIKDETDLVEYIETGDDNNETDPEELDRLFELVYGRKPNASEYEFHQVWDLICSGADRSARRTD